MWKSNKFKKIMKKIFIRRKRFVLSFRLLVKKLGIYPNWCSCYHQAYAIVVQIGSWFANGISKKKHSFKHPCNAWFIELYVCGWVASSSASWLFCCDVNFPPFFLHRVSELLTLRNPRKSEWWFVLSSVATTARKGPLPVDCFDSQLVKYREISG